MKATQFLERTRQVMAWRSALSKWQEENQLFSKLVEDIEKAQALPELISAEMEAVEGCGNGLVAWQLNVLLEKVHKRRREIEGEVQL